MLGSRQKTGDSKNEIPHRAGFFDLKKKRIFQQKSIVSCGRKNEK
jgi:hypothetical protein